MSRLLTVAIPTYRRAAKLDRQIEWFSRAAAGLEGRCELIISDNASPDDTSTVCAKWRDVLSARGVDVRINRMRENAGPLPNIARCIEMSSSRFTWVIGDDDEIADGTLAFVVGQLEAHSDLASIVLNFRGSGKTVYERCFHQPSDRLGPGEPIIDELLRQASFGLAFMTAQVYRTEFAQRALRTWPRGTKNYDYQMFVTAYTGLQGRVLATRATHASYVTGENIYERDSRVAMQLYADSLEVFLRLHRHGSDAATCRQIARSHLWSFKRRFINAAFNVSPTLTAATTLRVIYYVARLAMTRFSSPRHAATRAATSAVTGDARGDVTGDATADRAAAPAR